MPAKTIMLTEGRVGRFARPETGYALHWDAKQSGLGVRVTANGARSYVLERRLHGRTVRVTIGSVEDWKLGDARSRARELAVAVDKGLDPRLEAAAVRAQAEGRRVEAQRGALSVAAAWAAYIADRTPTWGERHLANHGALAHPGGEKRKRGKGLTMAGPLAALMPLKLNELTSERIAAWLKRECRTRSTSAAQGFRALRAFIAWTHDVPEYKGIVPLDACSARAVRDVVPAARTKEGDCLQREQLPAWFTAVRALSSRVISSYLQTLLLTGARREEVATLRWSDVDFGIAPALAMRDKVEGRRTIPLTPYVASLLQKLPRKNAWVFSSKSESGRLVEPRIAHNHALEAAGLPPLSIHGLRRSFGTLAEWTETPTGIVAQIMGHKPSALAERAYRRRPLDLLRVWHAKLEVWILKEAGVAFAPLPDKARLGLVAKDGSVQPAA
jgi:integrase